MLGSELWEDDFSSLLSIVKEFIVDVWESRKLRLYGENACPGPQPNSSGWDLGQDGKLWNGRNGRSGKLSHSSDVIGACICSNDVNVCGSAHCGCVVNGSVAMAALLLLFNPMRIEIQCGWSTVGLNVNGHVVCIIIGLCW